MTQNEYDTLSRDLRKIAGEIPIRWGKFQNDVYDNELKRICNIFSIMSLNELLPYISLFDEEHQMYYKRRWYLLRCADCDEYLFYKNDNVEHNPNRFDKKWDIKIDNCFQFDVKCTVIPRDFRDRWEDVVKNPQQIIDFYYEKQSRGVRYDMQNRLFIVHHSIVNDDREFLLRCAWRTKESVYRIFVNNINNITFSRYNDCYAAVIFIVETERNKLQYKISGYNTQLCSLNL